jgi:hypothetical protein
VLRYWHLIESILEPDLPSVSRFAKNGRTAHSNLEVDMWEERVLPEPGSIFAGILAYIDCLPQAPAIRIATDVEAAWVALHRAIVWPEANVGTILDVGQRSADFGREMTVSARSWRGPLAALRGHSLWREGEIARSASSLRTPLLLGLETAYGLRWCQRNVISARADR